MFLSEPVAGPMVKDVIMEIPGESPDVEGFAVMEFLSRIGIKNKITLDLYRSKGTTEWNDLLFIDNQAIESFIIPHTHKAILRSFVL